jgi:hypothetical protein
MRFWVLLVLAPASSLPCYIGDPHPKSQKSSKYSLFSLETQASRSAAAVWAGWLWLFFSRRRCQSALLFFLSELLHRAASFRSGDTPDPFFPLCVSEYHDYFMLLSLFLVISLW